MCTYIDTQANKRRNEQTNKYNISHTNTHLKSYTQFTSAWLHTSRLSNSNEENEKKIHAGTQCTRHTLSQSVSEEKKSKTESFATWLGSGFSVNTTDCCVCMWSVQKNDWLYALFPIFPAYVCFETVLRACVCRCCCYYYCFYATAAFALLCHSYYVFVCLCVCLLLLLLPLSSLHAKAFFIVATFYLMPMI